MDRNDVNSETRRLLCEGNPLDRRRAAVEMGRSSDRESVSALVEALEIEKDGRVLISIVLALGALGGPQAKQALQAVQTEDPALRSALRKTQGRLQTERLHVAWNKDVCVEGVYLETPEGLERPASLLLSKAEWPPLRTDAPGLLKVQKAVLAEQISPPPRWCYAARILIDEQPGNDEATQARLFDTLAACKPWARWTHSQPAADFPYRVQAEGLAITKAALARLIEISRAKLEPVGAVDRPSSYAGEIVVSFSAEKSRIYFRPTFFTDDRFAYRKRDVAASMNPVVAALLARLAPAGLKGAVIDPTCGSGVPLIERGLFDPQAGPLIGIDNMPGAVEAANENIAAAGMMGRATIINTDARDEAAWTDCGFVIANLPYGLRIKATKDELTALYMGILRRSEKFLTQDGRVVLASAFRTGLEGALGETKLRTLARYRLHTGGLFVQVAVLGRR